MATTFWSSTATQGEPRDMSAEATLMSAMEQNGCQEEISLRTQHQDLTRLLSTNLENLVRADVKLTTRAGKARADHKKATLAVPPSSMSSTKPLLIVRSWAASEWASAQTSPLHPWSVDSNSTAAAAATAADLQSSPTRSAKPLPDSGHGLVTPPRVGGAFASGSSATSPIDTKSGCLHTHLHRSCERTPTRNGSTDRLTVRPTRRTLDFDDDADANRIDLDFDTIVQEIAAEASEQASFESSGRCTHPQLRSDGGVLISSSSISSFVEAAAELQRSTSTISGSREAILRSRMGKLEAAIALYAMESLYFTTAEEGMVPSAVQVHALDDAAADIGNRDGLDEANGNSCAVTAWGDSRSQFIKGNSSFLKRRRLVYLERDADAPGSGFGFTTCTKAGLPWTRIHRVTATLQLGTSRLMPDDVLIAVDGMTVLNKGYLAVADAVGQAKHTVALLVARPPGNESASMYNTLDDSSYEGNLRRDIAGIAHQVAREQQLESTASWDSTNTWLRSQNEAIFSLLDSMASTLEEVEKTILEDELVEEAQLPPVDQSRVAATRAPHTPPRSHHTPTRSHLALGAKPPFTLKSKLSDWI